MKIRRKKPNKQTIFVLFFNVYTAVSVWEYDCSGMVIRVLVPAALVSEVTWTDAWLLPATENRLPLKEACFCKTRWMLGLLEACCSCWLSIPWRKAFTTRICKIKQKIFQRLNFLIKSKFHVTDLGHNLDDILKRYGETILDGYRKSINLYDFKRETLDNFSQNVLHKFPERFVHHHVDGNCSRVLWECYFDCRLDDSADDD